MWLSRMFKTEAVQNEPENGNVTISSDGTLEASSSMSVRSISAYSPYGYSSLPPIGEEVMLLPSAEGQAIVGTKLSATELESGEIQIASKGGAKIILKNDGSVVINSLVINKEGEIVS